MNGKIMTDILRALYSVYEKIRAIHFPYLLTCLKKKFFNYLKIIEEFIQVKSIKTMVLTSIKILCIYEQPKIYKILEKEKYTSHTIACLMVFMHAF